MSAARRRALSVICVVLAALLTTPVALAVWVQRTLVDADRFSAVVAPLVHQPPVQATLAQLTVDALQRQGIGNRPVPQRLGSAATAAAEAVASSEPVAQVWAVATSRAQRAAVTVLAADPSAPVSVQQDGVVLDLGVVVEQVRQGLADRGVVPPAPAGTAPAVQARVVLVRRPHLAAARTLYRATDPLATWGFALTVLLYAAAVVVAAARTRAVLLVGISLASNGLLLAVTLGLGRHVVTDQGSDPTVAAAAGVAVTALTADLVRSAQVLTGAGALLVLGVVVAGVVVAGRLRRRASEVHRPPRVW